MAEGDKFGKSLMVNNVRKQYIHCSTAVMMFFADYGVDSKLQETKLYRMVAFSPLVNRAASA